jgi:hypothetical protein
MTLKKGIDILKEGVDQQLEFIDWLKDRKLYNPMDSAATMNKMFDVWKGIKNDRWPLKGG